MRGVWTALITPFKGTEIDFEAYAKLLDRQRAAGVTGVIPCGTTGESPTLTSAEKKKLITTAVATLKGSGVKVFAGTGGNNTADTIEFSRWASENGVDGLLLVTPFYNKPSQAGLEAHFRAVADAVKCEVMLYNVPGRTGVGFTPETISSLAKHPRITSIKEASGNVAFGCEVMDRLRADHHKMTLLAGDDAIFLPLLAVGATGVVSVASNLFPRAMVAIQNAMDAGRLSEAREIHQRFYPLFRDLFIEANPVPIKYAMSRLKWCEPAVRLPLAALTQASADKVDTAMAKCGVAIGSNGGADL